MASENDKQVLPPYVSYSSLVSFINGLRENPMPMQIDRYVMPKASGSQISATVNALKYLKWIDANSKPTEPFKQFVKADDDQRKALLKKTLEHTYPFLFNNDEFNLEAATGGMMADKFRALGMQGATLSKAISFFLGAAKDAGIQVSGHIKPPPQPGGKSPSKKTVKKKEDELPDDDYEDDDTPGTERFQIPIPGKQSALFIIPSDLEQDDWNMLKTVLDAYIGRLLKG